MTSDDDRHRMLREHHAAMLWVYWALVLLGVWMVFAPLTFDYASGTARPSGGREVWLSLDARIAAMTASDIAGGILLMLFGFRSLTPNRPVSVWICCFLGIWLSMAPILFWSPTAEGYLNGTIVGALVIAFSILAPGMPNMPLYMVYGPDQPPGWTYNPSSWPQRAIMIGLAFLGWLVSRSLAAYQMGYFPNAWDPFFGDGTREVLDSDMSHAWPISDAAFGALAYTFEFLMGFMGGTARWRTMPWMVLFFGILIIPLGLVHILLVISQPVVVGYWCTLCLLAALIMLPMIPLAADEVAAMGQHMVQGRRAGDSLWRTFWKGSTAEGCTPDQRTPPLIDFPRHPWKLFTASIRGMSLPVTLVASAVLGLWLMFVPLVFGIDPPDAHLYQVTGALIFTFAIVAMGEVLRTARYFNVPLGLTVIIGPWLADASAAGIANGLIVGLIVALFALPRGVKTERYGLCDTWVR